MAIFLLDTNIIIDVLKGRKGHDRLLGDLINEGHVLACCPVNIAEIYAGMRPGEETLTSAFLKSLKLLDFTFASAELAGTLKGAYSLKGRVLSLADSMIAAVAICSGATLVTENVKDFPMAELSLYPVRG